jgi:hypothetical protein
MVIVPLKAFQHFQWKLKAHNSHKTRQNKFYLKSACQNNKYNTSSSELLTDIFFTQWIFPVFYSWLTSFFVNEQTTDLWFCYRCIQCLWNRSKKGELIDFVVYCDFMLLKHCLMKLKKSAIGKL